MKSIIAVLLVLVSAGAFAEPQPNAGYHSNGFSCYNRGYGSSIPVLNSHIQTSTLENPTVTFPSLIPPTTVSDACQCLQTLVRPQLRNDIITMPTVERITRTVATPVVNTINCGGTTRLTTFSLPNSMQSRTLTLPNGNRGSGQGSSGANVQFSGGTAGQQNSLSSAAANRATATLIATPTSVFTFHPSVGGGVSDCQNAFSGYANTGRVNTF